MTDVRVLEALDDLAKATSTLVDLLTSRGKCKAAAIEAYRQALLTSQESTATGRRHDAEIATMAMDAQLEVLDADIAGARALIHLLTVTIEALT